MNTENLLKLANYLEGPLSSKFDMAYFCDPGVGSCEAVEMVTCGSVGCAVGHGPHAGIPKLLTEDWFKYSERAFGLNSDSNEWMYLFSSSWEERDNTPQGAAARIRAVVNDGLPSDWEEQAYGGADEYYD